MLFSSDEVAKFINDTFEPAWESVRPAPLVTIDFGNGHVVKRTLQGNIATYVCNADGIVYDVLPGIYSTDVYRQQLEALNTFALSVQPKDGPKPRAEVVANRLSAHHAARQGALKQAPPPTPQMQAVAQFGGGGKFGGFNPGGAAQFGNPGNFGNGGGFQGQFGNPGGNFGGAAQFGSGVNSTNQFSTPVAPPKSSGFPAALPAEIAERVREPNQRLNTGDPSATLPPSGVEGPLMRMLAGLPPEPVRGRAGGSVATGPELKLDSAVNERIRRKDIHEKLAKLGPVRPDDIKKWLYKEVLHADLDDPLLGLGPVLDGNYPFADEDRALKGRSKLFVYSAEQLRLTVTAART